MYRYIYIYLANPNNFVDDTLVQFQWLIRSIGISGWPSDNMLVQQLQKWMNCILTMSTLMVLTSNTLDWFLYWTVSSFLFCHRHGDAPTARLASFRNWLVAMEYYSYSIRTIHFTPVVVHKAGPPTKSFLRSCHRHGNVPTTRLVSCGLWLRSNRLYSMSYPYHSLYLRGRVCSEHISLVLVLKVVLIVVTDTEMCDNRLLQQLQQWINCILPIISTPVSI